MNYMFWDILFVVFVFIQLVIRIYIDCKRNNESEDLVISSVNHTMRNLRQIKYQYKRYLKLKKKNDDDSDMAMNMAYSLCKDIKDEDMPWLELYISNACENTPKYIKNVRRLRANWKYFFADYYEQEAHK